MKTEKKWLMKIEISSEIIMILLQENLDSYIAFYKVSQLLVTSYSRLVVPVTSLVGLNTEIVREVI